METLRRAERALAKVEGWLLAASLIAMLSLAIYGIAYRNVVVPLTVVLADRSEAAGDDEPVTPVPAAPAPGAPGPAAPAVAPGVANDSDFEDDFADDPAPTASAPVAPPTPSDESDFEDDFADDPAPPAPKPEPGGDSDFEDDFADDEPAQTPVAAPGAPVVPPPSTARTPVLREPPAFVRFLLWFNFDWLDTVTRHLILWVAFFGAAAATRRRKHIAIDAVVRKLPAGSKRKVEALTGVISLVVCLLLVRASWAFTMSEYDAGGYLFGSVPAWVGPIIVPVGFLLIAFHYVVRIAEVVTGVGPDPANVTAEDALA